MRRKNGRVIVRKGVKTFDMLRLIYGLGFTIDSFNHYINTLDF